MSSAGNTGINNTPYSVGGVTYNERTGGVVGRPSNASPAVPVSAAPARASVPAPRVGYRSPDEAEKGLIAAFGGAQITPEQLKAIKAASALVPNRVGSPQVGNGEITSSADVLLSNDMQKASEIGRETLSPSQGNQVTGNEYFDFMQQNIADQNTRTNDILGQNFSSAMENIGLRYDMEMANNNSFYQGALESLQKQATKSADVANQLYSSVNPYADSTQASGLKTYQENINTIYQEKEATLRTEAKKAEQAISQNNKEALDSAMSAMRSAVNDADQQANQSLRSLQSESFQASMDQQKINQDQSQFNESLGLQKEQFASDVNNQNADNFRQLLASDAIPQTSKELEQLIESGNILDHPIFAEGSKIYGGQGVIDAMRQATSARENERNLDWSKFQLSLNSQARTAEKITQAERGASTRAAVLSMKETLDANGTGSNTRGGVIQAAYASAGGNTPSASATTQLAGLKPFLNEISEINDLASELGQDTEFTKIWKTWVGDPSDNNFNALQSRLANMNSAVARNVQNEVGNLSTYEQQNAAKITGATLGRLGVRPGSPESLAEGLKILAGVSLDRSLAVMNGEASAGRDVSVYAYDMANYEQDVNDLFVAINGGSSEEQNADDAKWDAFIEANS